MADAALQRHGAESSSPAHISTETFSTAVRALSRGASAPLLQAPTRHSPAPKPGKHQPFTLQFHLPQAWISSGWPALLLYFSCSPWSPTVQLLHYTKETPQLPWIAYTLHKKGKGWGRIILQLQYWKDMEINRLAQGYTCSLWQRQELNQNPPSPMLVPLLQAFPLCPWRSIFTFQGQSRENGNGALLPPCSRSRKLELQHS